MSLLLLLKPNGDAPWLMTMRPRQDREDVTV